MVAIGECMTTRIGSKLYFVVTPSETYTFATRADARQFNKRGGVLIETTLTPSQQIRLQGILSQLA